MRRIALGLATALAACWSLSALADDKKPAPASFVLNTEDYPPYQIKDASGAIQGENVKIIKELFKRAGITIEIKMDAWEKSFDAAKGNPGQGVFTTSRTPEREASFQWVGPLSVSRSVLLAKKSNKIKITQLSDASKFKIGGVTNDVKTIYLESQGLPVDKVDQDAKNAKRLKDGVIDLWATGYISGMKFANDQGLTDVEEVFAYREDFGYLALHVDTKATTVLELNRILDEMRAEGLLDASLKFKK